MILQASWYESVQGIQLEEFFASTRDKWRTETGRQWSAEIVRRRNMAGVQKAAEGAL
jgi:hypothetical protein